MKIDVMIFHLIACFAMLAAKLFVYYHHKYRPILRVPEDLAFPNGLKEGKIASFSKLIVVPEVYITLQKLMKMMSNHLCLRLRQLE